MRSARLKTIAKSTAALCGVVVLLALYAFSLDAASKTFTEGLQLIIAAAAFAVAVLPFNYLFFLWANRLMAALHGRKPLPIITDHGLVRLASKLRLPLV